MADTTFHSLTLPGLEPARVPSVAAEFTTSTVYAVRDYCTYQGVLYKCIAAHTGAWNASHFQATNLDNEFDDKLKVPLYQSSAPENPRVGDLWIDEDENSPLLSVDPIPTAGSTNAAQSGGTRTLIDAIDIQKANRHLLTGDYSTSATYEKGQLVFWYPETFSTSHSYIVGESCAHNGVIYKCIIAHEGTWNASHFEAQYNALTDTLYRCIEDIKNPEQWTLSHWQATNISTELNKLRESEADTDMIAENYGDSSSYAVGDYVVHNSDLFRCISGVSDTGSWDPDDWNQVKIADEVSDLKSALNQFNPSEIKIGVNLFDGQTTANKQVQSNSIADASGFYVSKPIYLTKGNYVYAVRYNSYVSNAPYYAITDENGNKLSIGTATQTAVSYTIGNATLVFYKLTLTDYCRVVFNVGASVGQVSITMVSKINTDDDIPTRFIPYNGENYVLNDDVSINAEMLADIKRQGGVSLKKNTNIFDGTFQTTEQYISGTGYQANTNYFVNAPIWINKGEKIAFINRSNSYGANSGRYIIVNSDNTQILYNEIATDTTKTITIGNATYKWYSLEIAADGYYVFNAGVDKQKNDFMVFAYESLADLPNSYVAYNGRKILDEDVYPNTYIMNLIANNLTGKKISLNGDSICAGVGYAGGYGKIIADKYGMSYQNIAVGGGCVAYYSDKYCISRGVANMDSNADYAIVEGGINDAANQVPLGSITTDFYSTNVYDDTTFYGAMESMFKDLTVRFAGKKIGYIIPHQCSGRFKPGEPYYVAAIACCTKWGVPVLDLSVQCPPFGFFRENTDLYTLKQTYTKDGDGWHPNEQGYKKYYVDKIIEWLESL